MNKDEHYLKVCELIHELRKRRLEWRIINHEGISKNYIFNINKKHYEPKIKEDFENLISEKKYTLSEKLSLFFKYPLITLKTIHNINKIVKHT